MVDLYCAVQPEIRPIEARLDRDEAIGLDTSRLRQALRELRWRLEYTADSAAARATLDKIRELAALPARRCADSPEEGRYGTCTEVWFLKLDASVDHLLAPDFKGKPPRFLDRINDPDRLERYLESLLVSRTGFFGATYEIGGQRFRTTDLSMTFHMARYLEGKINYWQQLIDTLLEIRDDRYPNGWLDDEGLTSHNNYDVATLFQLGWPEMRADQRQCAGTELDRLLSWCLATAITPDGAVVARAKSESMVEGYYFTIAFLDTIGYFDPAKRFWTDRAFPEAPVLQAQLEPNVRRLHPNDPMARMSLERLGSR